MPTLESRPPEILTRGGELGLGSRPDFAQSFCPLLSATASSNAIARHKAQLAVRRLHVPIPVGPRTLPEVVEAPTAEVSAALPIRRLVPLAVISREAKYARERFRSGFVVLECRGKPSVWPHSVLNRPLVRDIERAIYLDAQCKSPFQQKALFNFTCSQSWPVQLFVCEPNATCA